MKINRLLFSLAWAFLFAFCSLSAQTIHNLIPTQTATHVAVQSGPWFATSTWNTATVPGDAAIVWIPDTVQVDYTGQSQAHIFAIRVDGSFYCTESQSNDTTSLTFDTFVGGVNSFIQFEAQDSTDGKILIHIAPFDIEAHKAGTSGYTQVWNTQAHNYYSDGQITWEVDYSVGPDDRFNSYADALAGNTQVQEVSRDTLMDGAGVLGRYAWDSLQISLGLVTMGEIEILGKEKLNRAKLAADALRNQSLVQLDTVPQGWEQGDQILITRGGNQSTTSNGEDLTTIQSISGQTLTCATTLNKNHEGRPQDDLHCYVGNLTRNITFRSTVADTLHQRGHFMAMHNPTNVQIRNAAFIDMGRTDKSRLTDDFIWDQWLQPQVFKSKISALGQECVQMKRNPAADITNVRGRYSIHLHRTGTHFGVNKVYVTGCVVQGNPGWGITQHHSYADVSRNVVYDVVGAGIVSESGSEIGFWDDNLVVDIRTGHTTDPYYGVLFHDDYLFSGQGLGMKGRAVVCRGNVIANAKQGVGVMNMNPSLTNLDRVDARALATVRPDFQFDQFPLNSFGYAKEGDGVMPVEVALIMENTTTIWCNQGLRSIERDMGVNHESRSVFDGFYAWGVNQGLSITYQADYSFRDVFISGKNMSSIGAYLWKHSHNHVFDGIKMVDLGYGITVSKLVESGNGLLKTRNNGFTPWYFIDLDTSNVGTFYQLELDDPNGTAPYTEHGDNPIHLASTDLAPRPTTFTILDSTELYIDYTSGDLQFEIDGVITDDLGSYDMGIKQAWAQGTLRLDYPERLYEFASTTKLEDYLMQQGVFKDTANNDQLYFILNEYLPNRRSYAYTRFPIRVNILNAPAGGVFANPQIEPDSAFWPTQQLISRRALVTQSSTASGVSFDTAQIDVSPQKAIDGNNNGRINCQFYQRGLVPVGSFSQTEVELEPWYDLDLGDTMHIDFIDLWNTVELNGGEIEPVSSHFREFYVLISDSSFDSLGLADARALADFEYYQDSVPTRKFSLHNLNVLGRYVRIQAEGMNKIQLAEVEIVGKMYRDTTCDAPRLGTDVVAACDSFLWIDGNTYFANTSSPRDTLVTVEGCDSIVTLNLTVTNSPSVTVTQAGASLTASGGQNYQWVDCDNQYQSIPGATQSMFTPSATGNYAALATNGTCQDTSNCVFFEFSSLTESHPLGKVSIVPNPNAGAFSLHVPRRTGEIRCVLHGAQGQLLLDQHLPANAQFDFDLDLPNGIYHLSIIAEVGGWSGKLIIQE